MKSETCIFHHPFPVIENGTSGSQVRPYQMLKAFKELGFEVEELVGFIAERKKKIKYISKEINKGRHFAFLYSESQTIPIALTERHHFPIQPVLDTSFFKLAKKRNIPVGLFYRDLHWRFSQFSKIAWHKRAVMIPFYYLEWEQYKRSVNYLFLPSMKMIDFLPTPWVSKHIGELPPGLQVNEDIDQENRSRLSSGLRLLYIGGVTPPLYNLHPTFEFMENTQNVHLTLCCRELEWQEVKHLYRNTQNVSIVHEFGSGLTPLYNQADLFVILWQHDPYLDFAMPIKVFEALGRGLPIITTAGTETANFVQKENIGWVVSSRDEFNRLINHLQQNPQTLSMAKEQVHQVRLRHTWQTRAKQVSQTLQNL